jgi:hypothetical protein
MYPAMLEPRTRPSFCVVPWVEETIHSYDEQPLASLLARVPNSLRTSFDFVGSVCAGTGAARSAAVGHATGSTRPSAGSDIQQRNHRLEPGGEQSKTGPRSRLSEAWPNQHRAIERPFILHFAELPHSRECRQRTAFDGRRKVQADHALLVRSRAICVVWPDFGGRAG